MAVDRVERLLRVATQALDEADIPYAVVGGNAVAAWVGGVDIGAVRSTKDVDILLRRADLDAATSALGNIHLNPHDVMGVTMFLDQDQPNPRTGVHVVFAGQRIRPEYAHLAPDVTDSARAKDGFLVVSLPALVAMKLQSFRRIDQVHIDDMLSVELIDDAIIANLPADLRARLDQLMASPE